MRKIRVEVHDARSHGGAIGLLAPEPVDTIYQTLRAMCPPRSWRVEEVCETTSGQRALWMRPKAPPSFQFPAIVYEFATPGSEREPHLETAFINRYTRPSDDLAIEISHLVQDAGSQYEAARRIVANTASKFQYGHPDAHIYDGAEAVPALSCGLTKGSCIDINTHLIGSLTAAGIRNAYFAGYFFPEERGGVTNDMHCWVTSWCDGGRQEWDIAHHMKMGRTQIEHAYNPKPGERFAMTYGRGLSYALDGGEVSLSHFSEPLWVYGDGTAVTAQISAYLI